LALPDEVRRSANELAVDVSRFFAAAVLLDPDTEIFVIGSSRMMKFSIVMRS
jgi:hypothetical protein